MPRILYIFFKFDWKSNNVSYNMVLYHTVRTAKTITKIPYGILISLSKSSSSCMFFLFSTFLVTVIWNFPSPPYWNFIFLSPHQQPPLAMDVFKPCDLYTPLFQSHCCILGFAMAASTLSSLFPYNRTCQNSCLKSQQYLCYCLSQIWGWFGSARFSYLESYTVTSRVGHIWKPTHSSLAPGLKDSVGGWKKWGLPEFFFFLVVLGFN
jgi:hypothetical protein